jgi:ssDNA-binding replication factor A large subunit
MDEQIIEKIISSTGLSAEEVERRIREKQRELSDLVSREGAAYIVAKEMGLDLVSRPKQKIDIKNVVAGIRNLTLEARISRVFDIRHFEREGKQSKVANIILADGSGTVRMSLWDEQTDILDKLKPGIAVEISGAYTKEDTRGGVEIRLSRRGTIRLLEASTLPAIEEIEKKLVAGRIEIKDVKENENAELRAAIVQLFETEQFYEICPECGTRLKQEKIEIQPGIEAFAWKCATHGTIKPKVTMALSGVLDDGTGNIRVVFFRELAAKVLGMSMEEIVAKKGKVFDGLDIAGKEFVIMGRVRRNKMFDRLEFVANDVKDVEPRAEINLLLNVFASNNTTGVKG